jgi:hypothetical protein
VSWNEICLFKRVAAIVIISLDLLLLGMLVRVYMLPDKKDLRKVRPTLGSTLKSKTKTSTKTNAFELTKENVESGEKEEEEKERITLREYFKTTSNWNIAIDIISVLILIVELASTGIEKAGLLSCIPNTMATTLSP